MQIISDPSGFGTGCTTLAYRAECRLGVQCLMLTVLVPIADVITVAIASNAYGAKSQLSSLLTSLHCLLRKKLTLPSEDRVYSAFPQLCL